MGILIFFINWILFWVLISSIIYVIVELLSFIKNLQLPVPQKYIIPKRRALFLLFSISYIITTIFKGVTICM